MVNDKKQREYINSLDSLLKHIFPGIQRQDHYKLSIGEIDYLGFYGDKIIIVEVKASKRTRNIEKAYSQLERAAKELRGIYKDREIETFIYIGLTGELIEYNLSDS